MGINSGFKGLIRYQKYNHVTSFLLPIWLGAILCRRTVFCAKFS